jgi:uncharacterized protein YbdZ (MbtH family)
VSGVLTGHIKNIVETRIGPFRLQYRCNSSLVSISWSGEPVSINPFDGDDGSSFVLLNDIEQHSLLACRVDVPATKRGRAASLDYIERTGPINGRRV